MISFSALLQDNATANFDWAGRSESSSRTKDEAIASLARAIFLLPNMSNLMFEGRAVAKGTKDHLVLHTEGAGLPVHGWGDGMIEYEGRAVMSIELKRPPSGHG